ncbi:11482_t:CDS:2, partial [Dentiscutata heterogama]
LSDKDNIQFLQETIMQTYPNIFDHYSQTIKAFNTEKTLKNSLTYTKYQLQTAMEIEKTSIRKGIALNKFEKYLSPHETQALMDICFLKAVAVGRLEARISRHTAQSFLATIGVTSQCTKAIYHYHQHYLFSKIIKSAKLSASNTIIKCINNTEKTLTEQFNSTKL